MPTCEYCEAEIPAPKIGLLLSEEFFEDKFEIDVTASKQKHGQLECPECEAILGYLGVAGAGGGPNIRGTY